MGRPRRRVARAVRRSRLTTRVLQGDPRTRALARAIPSLRRGRSPAFGQLDGITGHRSQRSKRYSSRVAGDLIYAFRVMRLPLLDAGGSTIGRIEDIVV